MIGCDVAYFQKVSNIDQRLPELGAHDGSITARLGIYPVTESVALPPHQGEHP